MNEHRCEICNTLTEAESGIVVIHSPITEQYLTIGNLCADCRYRIVKAINKIKEEKS